MTELRIAARRGARWTAASAISTSALQFIRTALMAHFFLSSSDFGKFAIGTIAIMLLNSVADMGLAVGILRTPNLDRHKTATFFYMSTISGAVLAAIVIAFSSPIAASLGDPSVADILRALSAVLIFDTASSVFGALQERKIEFRWPATAEILSTTVGVATSLVLAGANFGVWSLVIGQITQSLVKLCILWACSGNQIAYFSPAPFSSVKEDIQFSSFVLADRLLYTLAGRLDQVFLSYFASISQLGLYALAFNYSILIMYRVNGLMTRVLFPMISGAANSGEYKKLTKAFLAALNLTALVNGGYSASLIAVAPSLVIVILGAKWVPVTGLMQLLCVAGLIKALLNLSVLILLGVGRSKTQFVWNVFFLCAASPIIALFIFHWGAVGAATSTIIVELASVIPIYFIAVKPFVVSTAGQLTSQIIRPIVGNFIAAAVVACLNFFFEPGILCLLLQGLVSAIVFPICWTIFAAEGVREVLTWLLGPQRAGVFMARVGGQFSRGAF
jgi:lipopolysaccharide exporter